MEKEGKKGKRGRKEKGSHRHHHLNMQGGGEAGEESGKSEGKKGEKERHHKRPKQGVIKKKNGGNGKGRQSYLREARAKGGKDEPHRFWKKSAIPGTASFNGFFQVHRARPSQHRGDQGA
ncbi:MAG: hypothetical protein U5K54_15635 [Cytophagales bacterium]|nr:hypothetical protein [Cytophagales bacterium]